MATAQLRSLSALLRSALHRPGLQRRIIGIAGACLALTWLGLVLLGCGGAQQPGDRSLAALRNAILQPVQNEAHNERNSRLVDDHARRGTLAQMARDEVRDAIGAGDLCGGHTLCRTHGFRSTDWYYSVGAFGSGGSFRTPVLIVGFDATGHVERTWNLRVH